MLRLVENVSPLPVGNLRDLASAAHGFAEAIESGRLDLRQAIIVTVDSDGMVDYASLGDHPTIAEALGLLELVKAKMVSACLTPIIHD